MLAGAVMVPYGVTEQVVRWPTELARQRAELNTESASRSQPTVLALRRSAYPRGRAAGLQLLRHLIMTQVHRSLRASVPSHAVDLHK